MKSEWGRGGHCFASKVRNPTNSSWWIVQILSTRRPGKELLKSHQLPWVDGSDPV
jgi:hypothetical protein